MMRPPERRSRPGKSPLPKPATSQVAAKLTDIVSMAQARTEGEQRRLKADLYRVARDRRAAGDREAADLALAWAESAA
ncbi:hypothetical protein CLV35_1274 [Motilibacter peucedani]|uniref:Uncharacterized protein n=1 Tax=Motilibacter peucedani TaxID=598650 RepID=A0A420XS04_9ACTN|nr:hypothetical protein CLV35_1274 [Motilibacter peucedani]